MVLTVFLDDFFGFMVIREQLSCSEVDLLTSIRFPRTEDTEYTEKYNSQNTFPKMHYPTFQGGVNGTLSLRLSLSLSLSL